MNKIGYTVYVSPQYEKWFNRFLNCIDRTLNGEDSWHNYVFVFNPENPDIVYNLSTTEEISRSSRMHGKAINIYGDPVNLSITFYTETPIRIMINGDNFINGVPISRLGKKEYRKYVINHETGHALGYSHLPCNPNTKKCPVMYQMTKGVPEGYQPSFSVQDEDYKALKIK